MAETVLRFGPEWLRALTDGGVSHQSSSVNPVSSHQNAQSSANTITTDSSSSILPSNKYKLAQYRYGREEMLALFDNEIEMAPELREIPTLTVDKCQLPLALIPITEEEHRLWSKSVNSEAMLRLNKMNTTGSSAERDRTERTAAVSSVNNERTTGPPIRTIRGGMTSERSRGRGRPAYYQRTGAFDENGETGEPREAFRKNYEKSTSVSEDGPREKSFDRSLSRGESSDEGNRNRKDVRLADNWRSGGRNDDRNNWRARGRTDDNWQRNHDSWRTDDRDGLGDDNHRNGPIMRRGYGNHYKRNSEGWDDVDDEERRGNLPEWSLDDDMSCEARVGTFDASGAFREGTMDDDLKDISSGHNSKENSVKKNTVDQNSSLSSESVNMDKNDSSQNDSKLQSNLDEDRISTHSYEESKVMMAPPISNLPDNNIDSQFQLQSPLSSQTHQPSLLPQIQNQLQNQLQNQQISSQMHSSLQPQLQSQLQAQPQPQFQPQLQPQLQSQLQSLAQSQLQPQLQQQLQSQLQPQLQQQLQSQLQSQLQPQLQPQLASQLLHQHQNQNLSQQQPQSQHNTQHHLQSLLENSHINHKPHPEEDGLSHLEKAAENMVAQWTAEADQEERVMRDKQSNKMTVVPLHHDDAYKWFYRDPQGEIQGPFLPQEMYEWSCSGYFTLDLLVRRGCDERFSQLGELMKAWGRMPFITDKNPPPVVSITPQTQPIKPINADAIPSALSPNSLYSQNPFRQQQIIQQRQQDQIQRQIFLNQQLQMQTQLRQLLDQLKKQDGFSTLSAQEQQCVLVRQYVTSQHQADQRRMQPTPPQPTNIPDEPKSVMEQLSRLGVPVVRSGPLLTQSTSSIWDLNGGVITASALEELQRRERDKLELEEKKKLLEKEQLEAQKRAALEAQRKREEEMRIEELTRKLEHEKKLREELLRDQEERRRREEEEEKRRLDQERMELEREKKRLEEERRRHEEMLRAEELVRKQREEERQRRQKEAEENERILRQEQMQQEMAQSRKSKQLSQQKQNQPALQKQQLQAQQNQQVKERKENQKQVQNQQAHSQKESKRIWPDLAKSEKNDGWSYNSDSPSPDPNAAPSVEFPSQTQLWKSDNLSSEKHIWGQAGSKNSTTISLAEIQRLQEAKEREEKIKQAQAQTERQNIYLEKQSNAQQLFEQQQKQQMKNQLTWARSHLQQTQVPVKTLAEIQREEAQKLEKQKKVEEKKTVKQNTVTNAGIWSNAASQLSWKGSSTNAWNQSSVNTGSSNQTSSSSGPNFTSNMGEAFWETPAVKESKNAPKQQKNSALQHSNKSSSGNNSGCSGKSKSRKEEEAVRQVFNNQRRQKADEFTQWCTEALSKYKSSIDIPTFVAFLKDVESPFDVNDYVNSYLGDTKETKDFANQFLEKRSFFRNQAKKEASEELMWGPAPAITPSVNKSSHNNPSSNNGGEGNSGAASKKKKKKAKKVANSILGFTVQSDPDRINAGEIETVDK